ncbi:MAG: alkaline phosphatase D family protein [Acidimicrobiales bacterium]
MTSPSTGPRPLLTLDDRVVATLRRFGYLIAVGAVLASALGHRYGWLDYRPGGAAFDNQVRPVVTAIFVVAMLIALRWEIIGGALAAFAGAALIAFAANQLVAVHAVIVVAVLVVPALCWALIDLADLSPRPAIVGVSGMLAMAIAGLVAGQQVYAHFWGPTHPESDVVAPPPSAIAWVWSGAVTSTSAEIRAHPRNDYETARLALSTSADLSDAVVVDARDESGRVVGFELDQLQPATQYHYAVEIDGDLDTTRAGTFRTFPEGASSFLVAIGSCARVGSNGAVFDTIADLDPLFYLIAGDFHYGDNGRNDLVRYQEVMDLTLSEPAQAALYRQTPVAYMWDDHDYGGNDADGNSPSRQAAMAAYREHVPSYGLSGDESAIYQAFTVGRVRFILTDARSARNLQNDDNSDAPSMLGPEQKTWLKQELIESSQTHELVVWLNPVPWIAAAEDGADHWGGYAVERREIADVIADNDIDNLLMISGDAHMVAIDDGTNTDYSTDGYPGFPLLHAAPLDRPGSVKGGPYSEGVSASGGQFATLEIADSGDTITATMRGLTWDGEEIMRLDFTTPSRGT